MKAHQVLSWEKPLQRKASLESLLSIPDDDVPLCFALPHVEMVSR